MLSASPSSIWLCTLVANIIDPEFAASLIEVFWRVFEIKISKRLPSA